MKALAIIACLILVCATVACAAPPTPTPTPLPPTPTPPPTATPEPVGDYVPSDIPRCVDAKRLDAFEFSWVGLDQIPPGGDWYYYRCNQKPEDLASFYRSKMTQAPYEWGEINWVTLPEGTLGVYFHTVRQTWLYLWFLADGSASATARLVVSEQGQVPLELPCCK